VEIGKEEIVLPIPNRTAKFLSLNTFLGRLQRLHKSRCLFGSFDDFMQRRSVTDRTRWLYTILAHPLGFRLQIRDLLLNALSHNTKLHSFFFGRQ
jgi:hypothetical protein